jgi:hypothetical protein
MIAVRGEFLSYAAIAGGSSAWQWDCIASVALSTAVQAVSSTGVTRANEVCMRLTV